MKRKREIEKVGFHLKLPSSNSAVIVQAGRLELAAQHLQKRSYDYKIAERVIGNDSYPRVFAKLFALIPDH